MDELKSTIAKNLTELRTKAHLTQLQLAEMLNYSDKAVSKWERGEAVPDLRVLIQLSEIYGVSLDDIVKKEGVFPRTEPRLNQSKRRLLITLLSAGLVAFVATVIFMVFYFIGPVSHYAYLVYVSASLPVAIVLTVFSAMWGTRFTNTLASSAIVWSCALIITMFVLEFVPTFMEIYFIFVVAFVFEILIIFWFVFRRYVQKNYIENNKKTK